MNDERFTEISEHLYTHPSSRDAVSSPAPAPAASPNREEAIAGNLYAGSTPQAEKRTEQSAPAAQTEPQGRDVIAQLRNDPERRLYPASRTFAEFAFEGVDPGVAQEVREIYGDLGMSPSDVRDLNAATADVHELPDATTRAAWQREAIVAVQERYGERAKEHLELANRFVKRDPVVAKYLGLTGFGNHPQVVLRFIELAQRQKGRF